MNRKTISIFLATSVLGALPFQATASMFLIPHLGFHDGSDFEHVLGSFEAGDKLEWASDEYEHRQMYFGSIQHQMSDIETAEEYIEAEQELVSIVKAVYPNMGSYWNNITEFNGVRVIQADGLIDLNRVYLHPFEMGARLNEHGGFLSADPKDKATESQAYNSLERMQKGLAPVGPDGQGIMLCRLNDDPRASYFEMDRHLSWRLLNAIKSGMTTERACLTDEIFGDYWIHRLDRLDK